VTGPSSRTLPIKQYFTSEEHLVKRLERHGRKMAFRATTVEEARLWQRELRSKVGQLLGLPAMECCELAPRITERVVLPGHVRERVEVQTEPEITAVLYVLVPDDLAPGERRPLVVAAHGHASAGKFSTAGRSDIPAVSDAIREYHYDYGLSFVREGWVVFCPDARGFGERRERFMQGEDEDRFLNSSCAHLTHMALPLGLTVPGMWTWDLMRLLDYAETRPDCDTTRIGCAGLSGGGTQTLYLTALDERVRCAVVSGFFYGVRDALLLLENCPCDYVPGLWLLAEMGDLGALCAPRAVLIETGDEDELNGRRGLANVIEQVNITRQAYAVLSAQDHFSHAIFHGPHRWDGTEALPWLRKWLS